MCPDVEVPKDRTELAKEKNNDGDKKTERGTR